MTHRVYGAKNHLGKILSISLDLTRDALLSDVAKKELDKKVRHPETDGVGTSWQYIFARASVAYASNQEHAQRLYDASSRLWFTYATPIISNGGTGRGLPISCNLAYVPDSRQGILDHYNECAWLSSMGAGIGGYWGDLRSVGTKTSTGNETSGIVPFIKTVESLMLAFKQGSTRRGSYAAYLDISHPEIVEFINLRNTGGDPNRKTLELFTAVNIPDAFMECLKTNQMWDLVDPHTKTVVESVSARTLWNALIHARMTFGVPYIHFVDASNRALPLEWITEGKTVKMSNLCSEILLPVDEDHTAVCCLSSINLAKWSDYSKEVDQLVGDVVEMLDNVLESYIASAPPALFRAVNQARRDRAIGVGTLGFHTFLQDQRIALSSPLAKAWNTKMFFTIKRCALEADKRLADERGPAPSMAKTGRRFSMLMAVAPNATSSLIANVSPSIEPWPSNAFLKKTDTGTHFVLNQALVKVLEEFGLHTPEILASIQEHGGSVQHLEQLDPQIRKVFLTAYEIDQNTLVSLAADRQKFICQGQSLNLFFSPFEDASTIKKVHFEAWKSGLKTLYYVRTLPASNGERVNSRIEKTDYTSPSEPTTDSCKACEG